jgi:tetratricopeptide (TPR) repeat protein
LRVFSNAPYSFNKQCMFLIQHTFSQAGRGILRHHCYLNLLQHLATVQDIVDQVHAGAVFAVAVGQGPGMGVQPRVFRQQRRVDIDHGAGGGGNAGGADDTHVSGTDDQVGVKIGCGLHQRAVESYQNYLNQFPNGINVLTAYYHKGESHAVLRQYDEALANYEWVVAKGPSRFYLRSLEKAALIAYNHAQDFNKSYDLYTRLEQAADTEESRFEAQLGGMRSAYRIGNSQAVYALANKVSSNPKATEQQRATANFYIGKIAFDRMYANRPGSIRAVCA